MSWKVICDRCGFQYWDYEIYKEWTGHMVCRRCLDPKDFELRIKRERVVSTYPEPPGINVSPFTLSLVVGNQNLNLNGENGPNLLIDRQLTNGNTGLILAGSSTLRYGEDVLLFCRFDDNTATDLGCYNSTPTVVSTVNGTITNNGFHYEGDGTNAPNPDKEDYINWAGTHFYSPTGSLPQSVVGWPLTMECFVTFSEQHVNVNVPFFEFLNSLGGSRFLLSLTSQIGGTGSVEYVYINAGFGWNQNGITTEKVDVGTNFMNHVAVVIPNDAQNCNWRIYINGELSDTLVNWPNLPDGITTHNCTVGAFGVHDSWLGGPHTIHGVRIKVGEVYTGSSFTPLNGPEDWPLPSCS